MRDTKGCDVHSTTREKGLVKGFDWEQIKSHGKLMTHNTFDIGKEQIDVDMDH